MSCRLEDCESPERCRGLCSLHYQRWRKHGDPTIDRRSQREDVLERFWSKVNRTADGCWYWLGHRNNNGYGTFALGGREGGQGLAHRFAYEAFVGPIPAGLVTDHLCRVRHCVNPGHLETVTQSENLRRGAAARRIEHLGSEAAS